MAALQFDSNKIKSPYLESVYNPSLFDETVRSSLKAVKLMKQELNFDTIAFTGSSGAALGYILGFNLGIPIACIRKSREECHFGDYSSGYIEGHMGSKSYIIVDDFIASGATIDNIASKMKKQCPNAQCVGIYLYKRYAVYEDRKFRTLNVSTEANGVKTTVKFEVPLYGRKD